MSLFRSRSFNVKLVKDQDAPETSANEKIEIAQAYAEIIKDVAGELATMTIAVIAVKGVFDVAKILARR